MLNQCVKRHLEYSTSASPISSSSPWRAEESCCERRANLLNSWTAVQGLIRTTCPAESKILAFFVPSCPQQLSLTPPSPCLSPPFPHSFPDKADTCTACTRLQGPCCASLASSYDMLAGEQAPATRQLERIVEVPLDVLLCRLAQVVEEGAWGGHRVECLGRALQTHTPSVTWTVPFISDSQLQFIVRGHLFAREAAWSSHFDSQREHSWVTLAPWHPGQTLVSRSPSTVDDVKLLYKKCPSGIERTDSL